MIQKSPKILYEFFFQIIEFQLCFWFIPQLLLSIKTFKRGENEKFENWGHLFHFLGQFKVGVNVFNIIFYSLSIIK
jgi:hypothetical protein